MSISRNEIVKNAIAFVKEWKNDSKEDAESQTFWNQFFAIFGIDRRRVGVFQKRVKGIATKSGGGRIDLFWKGVLLVEHKSAGESLDKADGQAAKYLEGIDKTEDLPKFIITTDFQLMRIETLGDGTYREFSIRRLVQNLDLFGFMQGVDEKPVVQSPVNVIAAEIMGKLHDKLKELGCSGQDLELYLVRLLYCLFGQDTEIIEKDSFTQYIKKSRGDGSVLGSQMALFFQVLNTPIEKRMSSLDVKLCDLTYVNGGLFAKQLPIVVFDAEARELLLECCTLNWAEISPAIFGSMFQSVMDKNKRRELGAHYTSEANILKILEPLFLNDLRKEFVNCKKNHRKLVALQNKLRTLHFFDPACGCGNFLIVAYRELRILELDILKQLNPGGQQLFGIDWGVKVDVDQFHGIEYEEFPSKIAEVAMWLVDHQMNALASELGSYYVRLPLRATAHIHCQNALTANWEDLIPKDKITYILGNPPFSGSNLHTPAQRAEMKDVFDSVRGSSGVLDYVAAWYVKASQYIQGTDIKVAFVSTNSITQGQQVEVLWRAMLEDYGVNIQFAHRTFAWKNEARANAAVYVIIISFAVKKSKKCTIYEYPNPDKPAEFIEVSAKNISPYLMDTPNVLIGKKTKAAPGVSKMSWGSTPIDNGKYLFTAEEKKEFLLIEPQAQSFFKELISGDQFLSGEKRYCLWLKDITPSQLKALPEVKKRVDAVRAYRNKSTRAATQKRANYAIQWAEDRQPESDYIVVPCTSTSNREYIPMDFRSKDCIIGNTCLCVRDADLYTFGVMMSKLHMDWVSTTCGRVGNGYRYSAQIVYNNFPWVQKANKKKVELVEKAAREVLDARIPGECLSDLYDPSLMPTALRKAHEKLDEAVDILYKLSGKVTTKKRLEALFAML